MSLGIAAELIRGARNIAVLTGAGMSTESGIPDFRGPNGVWTKDPKAERLSNIHYYVADPKIREEAWQVRLNHPALKAQPNPGHYALVELERSERLLMLVTQNIDGLHLLAGSSPHLVVEIHGNVREVICLSCGERAPMERALERVRAGEADPPCRSCGGILKSATISFGQNLRAEDVMRSQSAAESCDLFLAIGTSLTVYPAADLPRIALERGIPLVIINAEPTPYDRYAAAVIRERIGAVLPDLVRGLTPPLRPAVP